MRESITLFLNKIPDGVRCRPEYAAKIKSNGKREET
jgi:hypothetical protein